MKNGDVTKQQNENEFINDQQNHHNNCNQQKHNDATDDASEESVILLTPVTTITLVENGTVASITIENGIRTDPTKPTENSHLLAKTIMKTPIVQCMNLLGTRNIRVDFLAILFGIGSWILVNSVYIQLPLLVDNAPEGWSLPSFFVIVIQIGNIGPIAYTLYQKYSPRKINDGHMIYGIYFIGCTAALCMIFLHKITAFVANQERSVALMAIMFFFAIVGCTSSVLFMPYMGRFKEIYLITYLVGEGLSGFLPSILALIQGVSGNTECHLVYPTDGDDHDEAYYVMSSTPARFQTRDFFGFVFALMVISSVAFVLLNKLSMCKKEYAVVKIKYGNNYDYQDTSTVSDTNKDNTSNKIDDNDDEQNGNVKPIDEDNELEENYDTKHLSPINYGYLMFIMGLVSMFGSGIFPSVQSYSCLPYGNLAYHLTVTLSSIANPLACFTAVFLPHKSIRSISILTFVTIFISCYALTTAVMSPTPPLTQQTIGVALVVISWTLLHGLVSYIKLSITSIFRYQGGQSLVWVGAMSQAGSSIGAVISFLLVNYSGIFVSYQPC